MSELPEAINEMRNMRESYDQIGAAAEAYNTGKVELAENITAKGIPASASETLPELAEKVGAIAQTQTILEGGEVMAAQRFGDGALWNLYQVLADMKTRFMGNGDYAALIVCEYYKGYDSLQLQGADAYYTCDGDLYEYASPNHVWHDSDNGKANRWVAFLYRDEGARLDITNTAISPRSMYIGGHIGKIEYFVDGRLVELVCGVEETDVVDNFITSGFSQMWAFNLVFRNVKNLFRDTDKTFGFATNDGGIFRMTAAGDFTPINRIHIGANISASFIEITGTKSISNFMKFVQIPRSLQSPIIFSMPDLENANVSECIVYFDYLRDTIQTLSFPSLKNLNRARLFGNISITIQTHLIDVIVGEMIDNLNLSNWSPTAVLADATKKAQLIENIKNHILARVSDRTGLSQLVFTISTNMYNNIASEQIEWQGETMSLADAFITKNWLLAGA